MPAQYPFALQRHLGEIAAAFAEVANPTALLLLGSAARGELAYSELDGRLEVFSDYELLAVTERRMSGQERQRMATQLAVLEQRFDQRNPLFHIDVLLRQRRRLRTLPPIIFTYELKANAQVLCGEDVRHLLPEVTLANLDQRNTHEILLKRLWAILLHTPRRLLRGPLTPLEEMVWGYVLCRNALDLTTVLLPHCGVLLPSYGQRVQYLAGHYDELHLAECFGEELPAFLSACLRERQSLRFSEPLPIRYAKTIHYLRAALVYLLQQGIPGASPPHSRVASSPYRLVASLPHCQGLFNEWPISRGEWANLSRLSIDYTKRRGPLATARWLRAPKKGRAAAGLLAAHQALLAHQTGQDEEATRQLAESARLLAGIAVRPLAPPLLALAGLGRSSDEPEDFAVLWLSLRRAWGDFWWQFVRLGDPRYRQRFDRVMEWEDQHQDRSCRIAMSAPAGRPRPAERRRTARLSSPKPWQSTASTDEE